MKAKLFLFIFMFFLVSCNSNLSNSSLEYNDLDLGCFATTVNIDSIDQRWELFRQIEMDLKGCTVVIVSSGDFDAMAYKKSTLDAAYNMACMGDDYPEYEDFIALNEGRLKVPSGDGTLTVYTANEMKVMEFSYQNGMLYNINLWQNGRLIYKAEGVFDASYFDGDPNYELISGESHLFI